MYHSISDDPEPAFSPYYKVCTSPRRFAEHMQWLEDAGWRGVSLSDGLDILAGKKHIDGKPVAITFDDGFRDFHTEAFPILQRHGFSATMYLPTAFIGNERKTFKTRECLTWAEMRLMHQAGIEFGSHTVNHPKLVDLRWPEIETELRESKATIEQQLGHPINSFAYPYAFPQENQPFTENLTAVLRRLGYQNCATTVVRRERAAPHPFLIKRLPVNACDDRALLAAKLDGAYDWLALPQEAVRRWKSRRRTRQMTVPARTG